MKKGTRTYIYEDLTAAARKVVDERMIFPGNRPNTTLQAMDRFLVISLPVTISDLVVGKKKTHLVTTGVFYLYTRSRDDDTLDVQKASDFEDAIIELFPISGTWCVASNPEPVSRRSDGNGFQVTTISFDLRTRTNVFRENDE